MTTDGLKLIRAARTIIKVIRDQAEEKSMKGLANQADTLLNLLKPLQKTP